MNAHGQPDHGRPPGRAAYALEHRVRTILSRTGLAKTQVTDDPDLKGLKGELALALDQIERLRTDHNRIESRLVQSECYIGTELIGMEARTRIYSPYRFPERDRLQARLLTVEQERRRILVHYAATLRQLQDRLLALLNRHEQLTG